MLLENVRVNALFCLVVCLDVSSLVGETNALIKFTSNKNKIYFDVERWSINYIYRRELEKKLAKLEISSRLVLLKLDALKQGKQVPSEELRKLEEEKERVLMHNYNYEPSDPLEDNMIRSTFDADKGDAKDPTRKTGSPKTTSSVTGGRWGSSAYWCMLHVIVCGMCVSIGVICHHTCKQRWL